MKPHDLQQLHDRIAALEKEAADNRLWMVKLEQMIKDK